VAGAEIVVSAERTKGRANPATAEAVAEA
jgi:hypothetical protein